MPFEDIAIYRTIPGVIIVDVTDVPMLMATLKMAKDLAGITAVAVEDRFEEVGSQDYLREQFDLTDEHIVRVEKELKLCTIS